MTLYLNLLLILIPLKSITGKYFFFLLLKRTTLSLREQVTKLSSQAKWNVSYPILSPLLSVNLYVTP